jgi:hypothetical protein
MKEAAMKTAMAILLLGAAAPADEPARDEAVRKLNTMKVTVDFEDLKLQDALDYLREATGLNLVLQAKAGQAAGDERIKLRVKELSVKSILKLMLAPKGLAATWKEGAIVICPQEELEESMTIQMYDVRALMIKLQDFPGPKVELVTPNGKGPLTGAEFVLAQEPTEVIGEDLLITLMKENTGGRSWENPKASISMARGMLVVTQTSKTHAEIKSLLLRLGQFR